MTPRPRIRRRRSSSRHGHGKAKTPDFVGALGVLFTTFLLASVLACGPLILGGARLWIDLPLLCGVAALLVLQGLRLTAKPAPGLYRRVDAIDLAMLLFVVYAIVRWLTSPVEYFSRVEVLNVIACAGVFLTCRYGMKSRKHCMALLYALVALGTAETAAGYYLSSYPDWLPFGPAEGMQLEFIPRWIGSYDTPNHYASLLVMVMGATLALGSFSKLPWSVRIILFYLGLMIVVGVMFSGSRGGWLAMLAAVLGLVVMGIRNGTMRWWIPVTSGLALILVAAVLFSITPVVQVRLSPALVGGKADTGVPVLVTEDGLRSAQDHPLFGSGPGTSVFVHADHPPGAPESVLNPRYDDYLNCLDDYGLIGLGIVLFFIVAVSLKFFRPLWVDSRWQDRVLVATGFAAWLALLAHSLFDFNLHVPANALLFFALVGLALGRIKEEKAGHWSLLSLDPLGRGLGGAVIVLALAYAVEVARTTVGNNIYETTLARMDVVPISESLDNAAEALRFDAGNVQAWILTGDLHQMRAQIQEERSGRLAEAQKALDAFQQAARMNPLDGAIQRRLDETHKWMETSGAVTGAGP
jgi:O-antigen ligase